MKKVLLLCIGLNLAFESCTLKAVEKYCPFLKTSNTDTALMVAGVAGGFLASRLVKSAWRRLTTEFPIKPEHQYTYFSDQQLKIMQQSPLQRFKRNALETFTPLRMDEQVLLKIALTMQIGAMVSMPIPSYYYEYLTPRNISIVLFSIPLIKTILETKKIGTLRREWQSLHEKIQVTNPYCKACRKLEWIGPVPIKIEKTLNTIVNKNTQVRAAATNISSPNGFLFYGPPGNGKTFLARKIAKDIDACFIEKKSSGILSKWVGQAEKKVAGLIREAHREKIKTGKAICIVFLDEIEGIAGDRSGSTITSRHDITLVDTLLQVIEEGKENGIIFIGATNHLDSVDPAIRRSGRLEPIEITFPDVQEQRELISYYTKVHFGIEPSDYFINYFIAKLNEKNQVSRADIMAGIRDFAIISSNISEDQLTSIQDCFPDLKNQDEVKRRNCYSKYLDMLLKFLTKSLHPCIKERIFNEGLKSIASQEFKITYYNDIFQKDYSRKQVKFCLQDCKFTQEELDELM